MYSKEALAKCVRLAREAGEHYQEIPVDEIQICISTGNRKIGRVMNVSLMPMLTCGNCSGCSRYCYDIKACLQYPNTVIDARMRNTVLAQRDMALYFHLIDEHITHSRCRFFRWHVAGDIINSLYFAGMVTEALRHPDVTFWTYTKMYSIVNEYIDTMGPLPDNLHVMFSKWDGMPMNNPHGLPVFACKLKAGNADHVPFETMHRCPGNCDVCKAAGRGCVVGESSYADEH